MGLVFLCLADLIAEEGVHGDRVVQCFGGGGDVIFHSEVALFHKRLIHEADGGEMFFQFAFYNFFNRLRGFILELLGGDFLFFRNQLRINAGAIDRFGTGRSDL